MDETTALKAFAQLTAGAGLVSLLALAANAVLSKTQPERRSGGADTFRSLGSVALLIGWIGVIQLLRSRQADPDLLSRLAVAAGIKRSGNAQQAITHLLVDCALAFGLVGVALHWIDAKASATGWALGTGLVSLAVPALTLLASPIGWAGIGLGVLQAGWAAASTFHRPWSWERFAVLAAPLWITLAAASAL